jgi:hypothetical protein
MLPSDHVPVHFKFTELLDLEGPVMVLELCEVPLKDYLDRIDKVGLSADNLEDMLNFISNIASGVEHLHSRSVRVLLT